LHEPAGLLIAADASVAAAQMEQKLRHDHARTNFSNSETDAPLPAFYRIAKGT
jgi:hypothetical protein